MSQPFFLTQDFLRESDFKIRERESDSEKYDLSDSIFNSIEDDTYLVLFGMHRTKAILILAVDS